MPDQPATHHTNRLAGETSPYLLQHAHNPVDWYPWGDEAFAKARDEDKPMFLSIGYSACHWCHVMERESFENQEIAEYLNEHFVSVKVDREERPDVDDIYMTSVQLMTRSGGWPMSVFLTPDGAPFYAGTYFPPKDRGGMPGFLSILTGVKQAWSLRRDEVSVSADRVSEAVREVTSKPLGEPEAVDPLVFEPALRELRQTFDREHGGFNAAPKFPSAPGMALLMRRFQALEQDDLLHMAYRTLKEMAHGGMYDQLGGGFHRYSVDDKWLVPHFEKMLYDNGQLAEVYLQAYQVTGDPAFRRVAEETLNYVLRDMTHPEGGFYSSEDADSEGQEGKFYVWTRDEVDELLGEEEGGLLAAHYDVRPEGNFSSHEPYHARQNILHVAKSVAELAKERTLEEENVAKRLENAREKLLSRRAERVRPGLDDKVLASWNGLMISAFAQGAAVLRNPAYAETAQRAAEFVLGKMTVDGLLRHSYRDGQARVPAYLDDYAFLAKALLDLYEATFDLRWLDEADALASTMFERFWDEEDGGFFYSDARHGELIARTKPFYDGSEPSGNSAAASVLLRLGLLLDNQSYRDAARRVISASRDRMTDMPRGHLNMLCVADTLVRGLKEVAVIGPSEDAEPLLEALYSVYEPNKVVMRAEPDGEAGRRIPLLEGKAMMDGDTTAYVCRDYVCKQPVKDAAGLIRVLREA